MSCQSIRPELVAFHFGTVSDETRRAIEQHLPGCRACLEELLALKRQIETAELESTLRGLGVDEVVVCGMMTSMCVDATVRAAVDLGFDASVAHDACATLDLDFGGRTVPAADVHAAFLAALASAYARVAAAEELALGE